MRALGTTILVGFVLTARLAVAGGGDSSCVQDAEQQRARCRMACDDDFVVMRDVCRIDPERAAGCRAAKAACHTPILTALAACVDDGEHRNAATGADANHADAARTPVRSRRAVVGGEEEPPSRTLL